MYLIGLLEGKTPKMTNPRWNGDSVRKQNGRSRVELYPLLADESIELRVLGESRWPHSEFLTSWDDLYERAQHFDLDYDVYFGVAPRRPDEAGALRGTNQNVYRVPVVWLDADAKNGFSKEDRLAQLEEWKPTLIVDSGGGYHVYWKLAEDAEPRRAQAFMKALAAQLQCDDISDPAHILRVPGTTNKKRKRYVDVVQNGGPHHHLSDIEGCLALPLTPIPSKRVDHALRIALIEQHGLEANGGVIEGEVFVGRDRAIFDAACHFHNLEMKYDEILSRCTDLNQHFSPPLAVTTVAAKIRSALSYPRLESDDLTITEVVEAPSLLPSNIPHSGFTIQTASEILNFKEPPTEWMADGVLARGHIVYTMNPPKSGKTTVALNIGIRMAAGLSGAGLWINQPYKTLFLQPMGDMHPTLTREWSKKIMSELDVSDIPFTLATLGERADHFKYLHENAGKYDLVIVDTMSRLFPAVDDKDTRAVSEELDKIRRLRMQYPDTCWLYLVQVGKQSMAHTRGSTPSFAARGNSAIAEVFDDAIQILVPTKDIERDEELGLNLSRHIVMMGRGASQYRRPWRTRFDPETHVLTWVQDLTYDEATESVGGVATSQGPTQSRLAADLLGQLFLEADEQGEGRGILAIDAYRIGEENGFSKRIMKLGLEMRGGNINPTRGPKAKWWDCQIEVVE